MDKKLVALYHSKENQTVYIGFVNLKDNKIISQEEAIFEEEEFYNILKKWLVKYKNKKAELCKTKRW